MTTKHTPGPVTGPYHGPSIADQLRLIGSLCGTDHPTGKAEQRAAVAYVSVVTAEMLQALETIALHAPSLDAAGIREYCDAAIAKARGEG